MKLNYLNNHQSFTSIILVLCSISSLPSPFSEASLNITSLQVGDQASKKNEHLIDDIQAYGWIDVSNKWPLGATEFFVTHPERHSYVEIDLPKELDYDLEVTLDYFHDYFGAQPLVEVTACNNNIEIMGRNLSLERGQWNQYKLTIRKEDCSQDSRLVFNVILHDKSYVFAWKRLTIKSIGTVPPLPIAEEQKGPESSEQESLPSGTGSPIEDITEPSKEPAKPVTETEQPQNGSPQPEGPQTNKPETEKPETARPETPARQTEKPEQLDSTETQNPRAPEGTETQESETTTTTSTTAPSSPSGTELPDLNEPSYDYNQESRDKPGENRRAQEKRQSSSSTDDGKSSIKIDLLCEPSQCDRSKFNMKHFITLAKGLPSLPPNAKLDDEQKKFFVSTDSKPLYLEAKTTEDFYDINTCLNIKLYMEPGTEIEFSVEDERSDDKWRQLEIIKAPFNYQSNKWGHLDRCIDHYMPRLEKSIESNGNKHDLKMRLQPIGIGNSNSIQVALYSGNFSKSVSLKKLYPVQEYIPDVKRIINNSLKLSTYWIVSKEKFSYGYGQDDVVFHPFETKQSMSSEKFAEVRNINRRKESVDIESRWLRIENAQTLENEIQLAYEIERADWLKSIDLEVQSAHGEDKGWRKQHTLYVAPPQVTTSTTTRTKAPVDDSTAGAAPKPEATAEHPATSPEVSNSKILTGPVKFTTNLMTDEFRIKLRHFISDEYRILSNTIIRDSLSLKVYTLALGDACAPGPYCENNGRCEPTGPGQAKCHCEQGYEGEYCEKRDPCEIIYQDSGLTGRKLCDSVGAKCVKGLPVYKCIWPDDEFFKCQPLFKHKINEAGEIEATTGSNSTDENNSADELNTLPLPERIEKLKELARDKGQMVIILAAFLIALILFFVVIVLNLVNRLMKTRRQLREAQGEVHEMARRSQPSTSTGRGGGRRNRFQSRPVSGSSGVTNYSNQAFDAD